MNTTYLPTPLYLALCATEGGCVPLGTEDRSATVAFSTPELLGAHTLRRRVTAQVLEVGAARLAGMDIVLDPA